MQSKYNWNLCENIREIYSSKYFEDLGDKQIYFSYKADRQISAPFQEQQFSIMDSSYVA